MDDDDVAKRKAQFHALVDSAEYCNADYVSVVGSEQDGTLLFVAVYATGEDAAKLLAWEKARKRAR